MDSLLPESRREESCPLCAETGGPAEPEPTRRQEEGLKNAIKGLLLDLRRGQQVRQEMRRKEQTLQAQTLRALQEMLRGQLREAPTALHLVGCLGLSVREKTVVERVGKGASPSAHYCRVLD
ncbi:UNVERIFIED_CONTAM: hypothetical protein K2H54_073609 [Gekko kuhli]